MQSYSSPGRVITVQNSGPGAVEVRRDQPYRLRGLVGVTQHSAKVGAALNLCVEGSYDQFVTLAAGVQSAEAGDTVLMHIGTFALMAGVAADVDHVLFGLLCERINGPSLTTVKLTPASAATGGGGEGDPVLAGRVGDVEQAVIALGQSIEATTEAVSLFDGRLDQAEADIDAFQAGGGGSGGQSGLSAAFATRSVALNVPAGIVGVPCSVVLRQASSDVEAPAVGGFGFKALGPDEGPDVPYRVDVTCIGRIVDNGRVLFMLRVLDGYGISRGLTYLGAPQVFDSVGYCGAKASPIGGFEYTMSVMVMAAPGNTFDIQVGMLADELTGTGFISGTVNIRSMIATARRVA
jgi:hypothetical protein